MLPAGSKRKNRESCVSASTYSPTKSSKPPRKASPALSFEDQTKLEIGALSEVVLDRFVYDPNRSDSEVAVSIAKGIARFTTGVLRHESYKINTPAATIGVRGTVLDLRSRRARNVGLCRGRLGNGHRERGHGRGQCRASDICSDRRHAVPAGKHPVGSIRHDRDAGPAVGRIDNRNNHVADNSSAPAPRS